MTAALPIVKATIKYGDEYRAWSWWVGLIDQGVGLQAQESGLDRSRARAQRKMDKAAARFSARTGADARPTQEMVYDPIEGGWREITPKEDR